MVRVKRGTIAHKRRKNLGILNLKDALQKAQESHLDLIQITDKVEPPVCKIIDHGKYLYSERKQQQKEEKKQKSGEMKGIRLGFNISDHDLSVKIKQAEKFLKQGNKVRIEMKLRGREKALQQFAREKIEKFLEILEKSTNIKTERELKKQPRGLTIIIAKS